MKKSFIPNAFTFINLSCGIISLLLVNDQNFLGASMFILLGGFVDRYDGKVARMLNASSELGKELDSLADLVTFGVAPSILMYKLFELGNVGPFGIIGNCLLFLLPICGMYRLARFNATEFDGNYSGVPITIVGAFIAVYGAISSQAVKPPVYITIILMIIGSYLMVSKLKLKKV